MLRTRVSSNFTSERTLKKVDHSTSTSRTAVCNTIVDVRVRPCLNVYTMYRGGRDAEEPSSQGGGGEHHSLDTN